MADFQFLENPTTGKWVISAPRRSKRPDVGKKPEALCPFCIGREKEEPDIYRVGGKQGDTNWHIRVLLNKFAFAPHHELVIHSPDHHKNFDELPFSQVELIFKTYRERYNANKHKGQVYIFHNRGIPAGESLPHPHTQLVVVPSTLTLEIPPLDKNIYGKNPKSEIRNPKKVKNTNLNRLKIISNFMLRISSFSHPIIAVYEGEKIETDYFIIFCPKTSEWPDEVWIAPKREGSVYGEITEKEITDLAFAFSRLVQIFNERYGYEFPFNFYIYPGKNWYLRFVPRLKIIGGFEVGTQIIINTQDPAQTILFVKEHFWKPDLAKIRREHQADYLRSV